MSAAHVRCAVHRKIIGLIGFGKRVGCLATGTDASGVGDKLQGTVMDQWSENIIPEVSRAVQLFLAEGEEDKKSIDEALENAKDATCRLCKKLFDDWDESGKVSEKKNSNNNKLFVVKTIYKHNENQFVNKIYFCFFASMILSTCEPHDKE